MTQKTTTLADKLESIKAALFESMESTVDDGCVAKDSYENTKAPMYKKEYDFYKALGAKQRLALATLQELQDELKMHRNVAAAASRYNDKVMTGLIKSNPATP